MLNNPIVAKHPTADLGGKATNRSDETVNGRSTKASSKPQLKEQGHGKTSLRWPEASTKACCVGTAATLPSARRRWRAASRAQLPASSPTMVTGEDRRRGTQAEFIHQRHADRRIEKLAERTGGRPAPNERRHCSGSSLPKAPITRLNSNRTIQVRSARRRRDRACWVWWRVPLTRVRAHKHGAAMITRFGAETISDAAANGCPIPRANSGWRMPSKTLRGPSRIPVISASEKPNEDRGPKASIAIKQPLITTTAGVRHPTEAGLSVVACVVIATVSGAIRPGTYRVEKKSPQTNIRDPEHLRHVWPGLFAGVLTK